MKKNRNGEDRAEKLRAMSAPPRIAPENETAPMILNDISRIFHTQMRANEGDGIMTRNSARNIFRLLTQEEGLFQGEIARAIHVSAPTASLVMQEMENEGIICRKANPMDLRSVRVYLTDKGKAYDTRFHEQLHQLDDKMMRNFTEAEIAQLRCLLNRMRNNLLDEAPLAEGRKDSEI